MKTSNNAADQPKQTLLTGFGSFDSVAQNYTSKYHYCHKNLGKGVLPRCPLLEKVFNDINNNFDDIYYPPNFTKPPEPKSHREYKLTTIGQLIKVLNWWVKEKVEPEHPVFWFYAYSYMPCKLRVIHAVGGTIDDLITEFNFSHPAIAAELKELASNLVKKAIEGDGRARFVQQSQGWINLSPSKGIYVNPIEVKDAAAALLYKLRHIGSMVREETADLQQQADPAGKQKKEAKPIAASGEKTVFADLAKVPISELIKQVESHTLEFKEIPECNTQQNRKNDDVLFPSLKAIAGFSNAKGGTLLIGVDDSGKIRCIDQYLNTMKRGNNDMFEQQIRNCLRNRFEPQPIGKVNVSFEKFTEGTICRVDVQASKEPVHLDGTVYVRDGNVTQKLEGRALTDWIQQRKN